MSLQAHGDREGKGDAHERSSSCASVGKKLANHHRVFYIQRLEELRKDTSQGLCNFNMLYVLKKKIEFISTGGVN